MSVIKRQKARGNSSIGWVKNVDFIALEILEHLECHAIYFDKFILVADDRAYIPFLKLLDNNDYARLVRRGNDETAMISLFCQTPRTNVSWEL